MKFYLSIALLACYISCSAQSFSKDDLFRGNTLILEDVNFFTGKTELLPASFDELDQLALFMGEFPKMAIEIVGHTDIEGDKKANKDISTQRAEAAKKYLLGKGIDEKRINAIGKGSVRPLIKESNPLNQRIELTVISNPHLKRIKNNKALKQPGQDSAQQKRVALVIGNAEYFDSPKLKNPVNDANEMSAALMELDFEVNKLINVSFSEMLVSLKKFSNQIMNADVALFYFAGHGVQVNNTNYLLPVDAKFSNGETDVQFEAINLEMVLRVMEYTNNKSLNLIILDACRNNPFKTWTRGSDGLAEVKAPSGTLIAYSTSPGAIAYDGDGENGLYTKALIDELKVSQRVIDVFINTRIKVEEESKGKQSPWELAKLRGKFFLK